MTSREPRPRPLAERIIGHLRGCPAGASDAELRTALDARHQQVNQVCRRLEQLGVIVREHGEGPIRNRLLTDGAGTPMPPAGPSATSPFLTATSFEEAARQYFSTLWGVELTPREVLIDGAVDKSFDFVSADGRIVGDAKLYKNIPVPAAKFSTVAEYVWLLQCVDADRRFLVFGRDVEVPVRWLQRFGPLVQPVEFFFFDGLGHRQLWPPA